MQIGDRITVGWDDPDTVVKGKLVGWMPDPGDPQPTDRLAAVVGLDEPLTQEGQVQFERDRRETLTGTFLVLSLRYVGQLWTTENRTVHAVLSADDPRSPGTHSVWVAAHAGWNPIP